MKRLSQRFVLAAVAFSSAAVWQGLHLVSALECLIAFAVVYAITGAAQDGHAGSSDATRTAGASRGNAAHGSLTVAPSSGMSRPPRCGIPTSSRTGLRCTRARGCSTGLRREATRDGQARPTELGENNESVAGGSGRPPTRRLLRQERGVALSSCASCCR